MPYVMPSNYAYTIHMHVGGRPLGVPCWLDDLHNTLVACDEELVQNCDHQLFGSMSSSCKCSAHNDRAVSVSQ